MLSQDASSDKPPQSGQHRNSKKAQTNPFVSSRQPVVRNRMQQSFPLCYSYEHRLQPVFPIALSPRNQQSTEGFLLEYLANPYHGYKVCRILLNYFQNRGHPLSEHHWTTVDNNEFITPANDTPANYDGVEQLRNQSFFRQHQNVLDGSPIVKYSTRDCLPLNAVKRALPNQIPVHVYGAVIKVAVLTGFFKGRHTRKFAVTVAHLVNKLGDGLYAGNELLGYCCFKSKKTKIAGKNYTTDLALIAIDPKSRYARDKLTVIEIHGQRYRPQLCSETQIREIKEGSEVWIIDQFESLKIGKVDNLFYNNEAKELHNIIQIITTDRQALTIDGDSGCCVCLPPKPCSDVIEVIAMVIGISEFDDKTSCTNAVLLPIVLKHYFRNLPLSLKKVGPFCEDEGLPVNVDCSEDLDFYSSERSENITVLSEKVGHFCEEGEFPLNADFSGDLDLYSSERSETQSENNIDLIALGSQDSGRY